MFKRSTWLSFLTSLWLVAFACSAAPNKIPNVSIVPKPPKLNAKAYLLQDHYSGRVLAEYNADERIEPASLTKMMTVYVIDQELKAGRLHLRDKVQVSRNAWKAKGSRMFIEQGKSVTVHELIKGITIQSGNDASIAMAEHIAGTESAFAAVMNQYANHLGMNNTHFVNATGLPNPDHYTTARDLAILSRHIIHDFPETYGYYKMRTFTHNGITQSNRNRLLWRDDRVDGIKTGHTDSAGYCLVASAKTKSSRLNSILVGANSKKARSDQSYALLSYGMRFFETHKLYSKTEVLNKHRIWMGKNKQIDLGLEEDLFVTVPHGRYEQLKAEIELDPFIQAPVNPGQQLGKLSIELENKVILEKPLVALQSVDTGPFWRRWVDYIIMHFKQFIDKHVPA